MPETFRPRDADQVRETVAWAAAEERPLEIRGGGSKRGLGRPTDGHDVLEISGLGGVTYYEPTELVLAAAAGTPLAAVEAELARNRQRLAFEPVDYGPVTGGPAERSTVGGVVACNISGPRRIQAGAARDHCLGITAVSGRGEAFKSGGRVVKNVTGYDLSKLMAGSYGTLAVLTEVTFKVLPVPEETRTVLVHGFDETAGIAALGKAAASGLEPTALAHLPPSASSRSAVDRVSGASDSVTAIRIEGPAPSVEARSASLRKLFKPTGRYRGASRTRLGRAVAGDRRRETVAHGRWRIVASFRSADDRGRSRPGDREGPAPGGRHPDHVRLGRRPDLVDGRGRRGRGARRRPRRHRQRGRTCHADPGRRGRSGGGFPCSILGTPASPR